MKNANVFVDVDLTLVDANGKLLPGASEALIKLQDKGCHLYLWSSALTLGRKEGKDDKRERFVAVLEIPPVESAVFKSSKM